MIYWGDETRIDNCSNCERGFAPKGQPPVLLVETKRKRLNMLSALSRQGGHSLYAIRRFHEPAASDPIDGPAGSNLQPKTFPDSGQLKGPPREEERSLAGRASGENRAVLSAALCPESNPDEYPNHALKRSVHSGDLYNRNALLYLLLFSALNYCYLNGLSSS